VHFRVSLGCGLKLMGDDLYTVASLLTNCGDNFVFIATRSTSTNALRLVPQTLTTIFNQGCVLTQTHTHANRKRIRTAVVCASEVTPSVPFP
jgi:glycine cleavage system regulatory protein